MALQAGQVLLAALAALAGISSPQQLYPTPQSFQDAEMVCCGRLVRIEFAQRGGLAAGGAYPSIGFRVVAPLDSKVEAKRP